MGQQAQAPAIHHLVDDLDIDRSIGLICIHASKPNGLGLQKARFRAESVFWLGDAYSFLSPSCGCLFFGLAFALLPFLLGQQTKGLHLL